MMAPSLPRKPFLTPSLRASNITCSRWQAARDTAWFSTPRMETTRRVPSTLRVATVWVEKRGTELPVGEGQSQRPRTAGWGRGQDKATGWRHQLRVGLWAWIILLERLPQESIPEDPPSLSCPCLHLGWKGNAGALGAAALVPASPGRRHCADKALRLPGLRAPVSTWRRWLHSGDVATHGMDHRPLYSVSKLQTPEGPPGSCRCEG